MDCVRQFRLRCFETTRPPICLETEMEKQLESAIGKDTQRFARGSPGDKPTGTLFQT
jgi:hypothetical protein